MVLAPKPFSICTKCLHRLKLETTDFNFVKQLIFRCEVFVGGEDLNKCHNTSEYEKILLDLIFELRLPSEHYLKFSESQQKRLHGIWSINGKI